MVCGIKLTRRSQHPVWWPICGPSRFCTSSCICYHGLWLNYQKKNSSEGMNIAGMLLPSGGWNKMCTVSWSPVWTVYWSYSWVSSVSWFLKVHFPSSNNKYFWLSGPEVDTLYTLSLWTHVKSSAHFTDAAQCKKCRDQGKLCPVSLPAGVLQV